MIIIIDTNTGKSYYSNMKTKIADYIGVHRNTITNWISKGNTSEKYNQFIISFESKKL